MNQDLKLSLLQLDMSVCSCCLFSAFYCWPTACRWVGLDTLFLGVCLPSVPPFWALHLFLIKKKINDVIHLGSARALLLSQRHNLDVCLFKQVDRLWEATTPRWSCPHVTSVLTPTADHIRIEPRTPFAILRAFSSFAPPFCTLCNIDYDLFFKDSI